MKFFKKLCRKKSEDEAVTVIEDPQPVEEPVEDVIESVSGYLRVKFDELNTKRVTLQEGALIFRGQSHSNLPSGASFWSESEAKSKDHAKPFLVKVRLKEPCTFLDFKGFVDCIIGRFSDFEELSDLEGANKALRRLSDNGFFEKFLGIDGVIDSTAFIYGRHEKVFFFRSSKLQKIESNKMPNK